MPDAISTKLSGATSALAHANKMFPTPKPAAAPAAPAASKPSMSVGEPEKGTASDLKAKSDNVDSYVASLPKMHSGGMVPKDGAYQMKAGEHVLTAPEAKLAMKHALMASGMKSLAKNAGKAAMGTTLPATAGKPMVKKMGEKKSTSGITVRPEKMQGAKIMDKTKK